MKQQMTQFVKDVAQEPKVAVGVSAATTGSGLGYLFDWIPSEIGKLATLIGIILSLVLIYTHIRRGLVEYRKGELDIKIAEARLEEIENRNGNGC